MQCYPLTTYSIEYVVVLQLLASFDRFTSAYFQRRVRLPPL